MAVRVEYLYFLCLGISICLFLVVEVGKLHLSHCDWQFHIWKPESTGGKCFLKKYCFHFIYKPKQVCFNDSVLLFTFIFSHPSNSKKRNLIRDTWANKVLFNAHQIRAIFLVGKSIDKEQGFDESFWAETMSHQDLVVIDQEDSFNYLTVKGIFGLHIATTLCPKAEYVMKTEDDMLINTFALIDELQHFNNSNTILGYIVYNAIVPRWSGHTSLAGYPNNTWPPFYSGSGFVMSADVSRALYYLALNDARDEKDMISIDDVYITGVLVSKLGLHFPLKHINIAERFLSFDNVSRLKEGRELSRYIFFEVHDRSQKKYSVESVRLHRTIWEQIMKVEFREMALPSRHSRVLARQKTSLKIQLSIG